MDVYYTSDVDETSKDDLYYESLSGERNRATVRLEIHNVRLFTYCRSLEKEHLQNLRGKLHLIQPRFVSLFINSFVK